MAQYSLSNTFASLVSCSMGGTKFMTLALLVSPQGNYQDSLALVS
jgi:hypothetical protein